MKLKLDDKGNVVVQDGKPVYVKDDGSEVAFDVVGTTNTISRLNAEAKGHRERAEAAEGKLKSFDGIEDPEAAKKALGTVANLDAKKLIEAGEVEKVKGEIKAAYEKQLADANSETETLRGQLHGHMVGGSFTRSKFVTEKLAIPADLVEARFGKHFNVVDGKVVATDANGNKIYSASNPGELADFDEALTTIVGAYPQKNQILKGSGAAGGGSGGSGGGKSQTKGDFGGSKSERVAAINAKFSLPS
ncbi:DUF6651 domain-containing protein [Roseateles sp. YR242]|uniref:DUF6651 domain-containing protein n=1 Tax=Roseateles sp. YR242 TaxID=1855305 RepID=UPI000B888C01|nr:DUF6651 domain-containing protein [Roseateles sp. YR242]